MIAAETAKRTPSLPQSRLLLVRALWFLLALPSFALVFYGIAANAVQWWQLDLTSCPAGEFYAACLANAQAMRELGVSPRLFAVTFTVGLVIQNVSFLLVGALIFWRRFSDLYAILLSLNIILLGTFMVDTVFPLLLMHRYPQFELPVRFMTTLGVMLMVLWYRFPDGRFVPRWMRVPAGIWYGAITAITFLFPTSPLSTETWSPQLYALTGYAFILSVVAALIHRYLRVSGPVERQQIKWVVVFGAVFGILHIVNDYILLNVQPGRQDILRALTILPVGYLAAGLFAASMGIAILRHRLWDIDVIIRRTITYAMLTGGLALIYYASVIVLQTVINTLTGGGQSDMVTVLSTLAIAAAFSPLRRQIKAVIDRAFYRSHYDAEGAITAFSLAARSEVDLASLSERLIRQVEETMQPAQVSLWLRAPAAEPPPQPHTTLAPQPKSD